MKNILRILIVPLILSACTVRNWSETIELEDGSKVVTWAQTNILAPSMSGPGTMGRML